MFALVDAIRMTPVGELHIAARLVISAAAGVVIYVVLMTVIFRSETQNFLAESADLVPGKLKPIVLAMHRPIRM